MSDVDTVYFDSARKHIGKFINRMKISIGGTNALFVVTQSKHSKCGNSLSQLKPPLVTIKTLYSHKLIINYALSEFRLLVRLSQPVRHPYQPHP